MQVIHALEKLPKSIFLAGPTPRDENTPSWRPQALEILRDIGFDGTVYVPESANWASHDSYDDQVLGVGRARSFVRHRLLDSARPDGH